MSCAVSCRVVCVCVCVCVCVQQSLRQISKPGASKQARPAAGELVADDRTHVLAGTALFLLRTLVYSRAMVEMSCACVQQSLRQISKPGASKQARLSAGELVADSADAEPRPCRYSAISYENTCVF